MADENVEIRDANGEAQPVDVRTITGGDKRQVVLLGDGETTGLVSPATETTLASLLTELGGKVEPADLAAIATAAKQDAAKAVLDAILAAVDGVASETTLAAVQTALGGTLLVTDGGTFGGQAGTGDATIDVPSGARVRRVMVVAHATSDTTVTLPGVTGTITVLAGGYFDEQIPGRATAGGDVVIGGGDSRAYYVAWTT